MLLLCILSLITIAQSAELGSVTSTAATTTTLPTTVPDVDNVTVKVDNLNFVTVTESAVTDSATSLQSSVHSTLITTLSTIKPTSTAGPLKAVGQTLEPSEKAPVPDRLRHKNRYRAYTKAKEKLQKMKEMEERKKKKERMAEIAREKDQNRPQKKVCLECQKRKLKKEQKEFNRRASLKEHIMSKLHLDSPTLAIPRPTIPPEVLRSTMDDESEADDNNHAKTTEVIIFGRDVTKRCRHRTSTGCFKFNLRNKIHGEIKSAELLVYKLHDPNDGQQTFFLSELERPKFRKLMARNIITRMDTDVTEGWLSFRVDKSVQRWVKKPYMNDGIAVKCKTCMRRSHKQLYSAKEGFNPLLIVHIKPPSQRRRQRRSLECRRGITKCCKRNFWISFEEIALTRVLHPQGVWANYCTGTCDLIEDSHTNHTMLLQAVRWLSETANNTIRDAIAPCCGAVRLKSVSLLYVDNNQDISHSIVPNLAVEECGCL